MMLITRHEVELAVQAIESIAASLDKIANPPILVTSIQAREVWVAFAAINDNQNAPASEYLGIYSTEEFAQRVADKRPRTGFVERVVVDEVPKWLR